MHRRLRHCTLPRRRRRRLLQLLPPRESSHAQQVGFRHSQRSHVRRARPVPSRHTNRFVSACGLRLGLGLRVKVKVRVRVRVNP